VGGEDPGQDWNHHAHSFSAQLPSLGPLLEPALHVLELVHQPQS